MKLSLTAADQRQLDERGIRATTLESQVQRFINGIPPIALDRPCTVGDGIQQLSLEQVEDARSAYLRASARGEFGKFVPASGAASRMFKPLLEVMNEETPVSFADLKTRAESDDSTAAFAVTFLSHMPDFAFAEAASRECLNGTLDCHAIESSDDVRLLLRCLLEGDGLALAAQPKGLIPFHKGEPGSRTPVMEQLDEAVQIGGGSTTPACVHFTIPPGKQGEFEAEVERWRESQEGASVLEVTYSEQRPDTDTVAVDLDNHLFREADGSLLFRPGGHGALIHNLNGLDYPYCLMKNIDNVVPPHRAPAETKVRQILAGYCARLTETRNELFQQTDAAMSDLQLSSLRAEVASSFGIAETQLAGLTSAADFARWLNRPVRVCGMVRSDGDPGGGPFWVRRADGSVDRQIVETSQIDTGNPDQAAILAQATHFNPVDIVCSLRDVHGERFNLHDFVDPDTAFIARKSKSGRELKALELPGLWNGAMADWITVFVEIPASQFNPVKTVNDLLKPAHQPE